MQSKAGPKQCCAPWTMPSIKLERSLTSSDQAPSDFLWELIPMNDELPSSKANASNSEWDVFISHASEDKDDLPLRPLADALRTRGFSVWLR